MRKYVLIVFVAVFLPAAVWAMGSKPTSPIEVTLAPATAAGEVLPGQVVEMNATVTTRVDIERMEIRSVISGGAALAGGESVWEGSLKRGEAITLVFLVRTSGSGKGRVRVTAKALGRSGGGVMSGVGQYRFGGGEDFPGQAHKGVPKVDGNSNKIIEFKGQ